MPYYTVVAKDAKTGYTKTHKGIRAKSQGEAISQVSGGGNRNMTYQAWMSKHGKDSVVHLTRRSFWSVLARRGRNSVRRRRNYRTEFLRAWQIGCDEWNSTASVFGLTRPTHKDVLND